MFILGQRSMDRLVGVHANLVRVVRRAIQLSSVDFAVLEGVRSRQRQAELYAQGRTKPGKIVTWTMNSRHIPAGDGFGHAVDLGPIKDGQVDWNNAAGFSAINAAMMQAAGELGIAIRWGKYWDRDGVAGEKGETDGPHWELV